MKPTRGGLVTACSAKPVRPQVVKVHAQGRWAGPQQRSAQTPTREGHETRTERTFRFHVVCAQPETKAAADEQEVPQHLFSNIVGSSVPKITIVPHAGLILPPAPEFPRLGGPKLAHCIPPIRY